MIHYNIMETYNISICIAICVFIVTIILIIIIVVLLFQIYVHPYIINRRNRVNNIDFEDVD